MEKFYLKQYVSKNEIKTIEVITSDHEIVPYNPNLLLAFNTFGLDENKKEMPFFEVKKIQFMAWCKSSLFRSKLLVAAYLDNDGMIEFCLLNVHSISSLYPEKKFSIIDYVSYCEINNLLSEKPVLLKEYIKSIFEGSEIHNSF